MTYVIQLDGAHVLPFACRHPRRFASADVGPPYFATVARTTVQLKMKPVTIIDLDAS
jgi:hypothetical protein